MTSTNEIAGYHPKKGTPRPAWTYRGARRNKALHRGPKLTGRIEIRLRRGQAKQAALRESYEAKRRARA